jgi:hypothetical protein
VDELAAKKIQVKLEQKISDWSLQRLHRERRLKHMKIRMIIVGLFIIMLQAIHIFIPHLTIPPYNSLVTLGLSIWLATLVVKYSIGYKDKKCTRSANEIIRLAAEYNEAIKDIPEARHCDFLPVELVQHKKFNFTSKMPKISARLLPKI